MTFLKSLWADLIEKRLWPIALVLLLALVAVPVFLGSGGEEPLDAAALGATGATGGVGAQALVSLDEPGAVRLDRDGKLRDPFKQRGGTGATGLAAAADTTPSSATPDAQGSGGGKPSTGTPGTRGGPGQGDTTGPQGGSGGTSPGRPDLSTYVTELRLGRASGSQPPRRTVARLTPLPNVERPFFAYLGVLSDRRTAVFLLSSDVKATGEGACRPDTRVCETIELRRGDTQTLKVTGDDGSTTTYTLSVLDVRRKGAAASSGTTSLARKSAPKQGSPAQAGASGETDLGTDQYTYDDDTGLLRRVAKRAQADPAAAPRATSFVEQSRRAEARAAARRSGTPRAAPELSP